MSEWGDYVVGRSENWGSEEFAEAYMCETLQDAGIANAALTPAMHMLARNLEEVSLTVRADGLMLNALNLQAGTFQQAEYGRFDGDYQRSIVTLPIHFGGSNYYVANLLSQHDVGYSPVCSRVLKCIDDKTEDVWCLGSREWPLNDYSDNCTCMQFSAPFSGKKPSPALGINFAPSELAMLQGSGELATEILLDFGRAIGEIALQEGIATLINSVPEINKALIELKSYYSSLLAAFEGSYIR